MTGVYGGFGFIQNKGDTGEGLLPIIGLPPNQAFDVGTFPLRNTGNPVQPQDAATKSYHDANSISAILTNKGEIVVSDGSDPIAFGPGLDDRVIVYDASEPTGLRITRDLDLNELEVNELAVDKITANNTSNIEFEEQLFIEGSGTNISMQIGDIAIAGTTDSELNMESKINNTIFLQSDTDQNGSGNSIIANTIDGNEIYSDIILDSATKDILFRAASEGATKNPFMIFQTNGSYMATTGLPVITSIDEAFRIRTDDIRFEFDLLFDTVGERTFDKNVSINGVTFSNNGLVAARSYTTTSRDSRINTVTLSARNILSSTLISNNTAVSTYTLPSPSSVVAEIPNAFVGQTFRLLVLNNGTNTLTIATPGANVIFLNTMTTISSGKAAFLSFTINKIEVASEEYDVFNCEFFPN